MEEVRVLPLNGGSSQSVPRSVGPKEYKDPQVAQDAPVEHNNNKIEVASDASVISPSLERVLSRASGGTKVKFSADSPADGSRGKINFQVVDKESGEVVRSFPSEEIKKVIEASNASFGEGLLVDTRV